MVHRVHVSIVAKKALVFDLHDVKFLRSLGIGGVLSGTLPIAPQQNIFLGLPLQLMVEELVWLIEQDVVDLFPEKEFIDNLINDLSEDDIKSIQQLKYEEFELQKAAKIEQKKELAKTRNKSNQGRDFEIPNDLTILQSLSISISDTPNNLPNYELFKSIFIKNSNLRQKKLLSSLNYNELNYKIFKHLKKLKYFLAPGLRFGGKFIAYPGDPLRYHAHLIVNSINWNKDIGLMNIVSGGRLATGVKKIWLIGSEDEVENENENKNNDDDNDNKPIFFSVEWAGFG